MKKRFLVSLCLVSGSAISSGSDSYLGEILWTAASYCPLSTVEANGQLLDVKGNETLASLLGNRFGGDGKIKFGLPNLRGQIHSSGLRSLDPKKKVDLLPCIAIKGAFPARP